MKNRQLLKGFLIGIIIGAIIGISVYGFFSRSEPYSIHTGGGGALKIDKRTGETWTMYEGKWNPVATGTSTTNQPHIGDWLERLLSGLIGGLLTVLGFVLTSIWKNPRQDSNQQDPPTSNKMPND